MPHKCLRLIISRDEFVETGRGAVDARRGAERHNLKGSILASYAVTVTGPAYDLRRRLRLARTGQHVQAHVLSC